MTNNISDNDSEIIENCQLQWDKRRGVLYVHNRDTGATVLRISRLPESKDKLTTGQMIDITGPFERISLPQD